jgi:release factor glutamine methyltransferase
MDSIQINPNEEVLEIGTGTGIIGIKCAFAGAKVTVADINPHAIKCAKENANMNNVNVRVIKSDLFKNVRGTFDVIIFNPPYLPTAKEDHCSGWIDKALDGGRKGDKIIMRFLRSFKIVGHNALFPDTYNCPMLRITSSSKHLKPGGRVYLLLSSLSNIERIEAYLKKNNMSYKKIAEKKLDFETLFVFEIRFS